LRDDPKNSLIYFFVTHLAPSGGATAAGVPGERAKVIAFSMLILKIPVFSLTG